MRDHLLKNFPAAMVNPDEKVDRLTGTPALQTAIINGWLKAEDFGLDDRRHSLRPRAAYRFGTEIRLEPTVWTAPGYDHPGLAAGFTHRMQCLQRLDCLGVVDGRKAVDILAQHQMLSTNTPPGRRKISSPGQWHGLFLTSGENPITETYNALKALELFGALGCVDREACAHGILRFHHGKGLFLPVKGNDDVVLFGDARETFCAFESLRILGALDLVEDLNKWQFRPFFASAKTAGESRSVTWSEIEAWILQQRLERYLGERKVNPHAVPRSLLDP